MPGIAGIIRTSPLTPGQETAIDDSEPVRKMVERMEHERELASGQMAFQEVGVCAGWVTRHGSFADGLPAWNADRTVALLLAGEEFSTTASEHFTRASRAAGIVQLY